MPKPISTASFLALTCGAAVCAFASAGDTSKEESLYRVWQRIPLSVINTPYVPYNPPAE